MRKTALLALFFLALPTYAEVRNTNADSRGSDRFRSTLAEVCSRVSPRLRTACEEIQPGRRQLAGNIIEYNFRIPVGTGQYDFIGIHRVVKERAPWRPVRTSRALMMAHGDIWGFRAAFLTPPNRNLPVFLASNGIDVWGIDFGWSLAPSSTTDFSFMRNWGIERDARDLGVALAIARGIRFATNEGAGKM